MLVRSAAVRLDDRKSAATPLLCSPCTWSSISAAYTARGSELGNMLTMDVVHHDCGTQPMHLVLHERCIHSTGLQAGANGDGVYHERCIHSKGL